jgi:hypothetical protein
VVFSVQGSVIDAVVEAVVVSEVVVVVAATVVVGGMLISDVVTVLIGGQELGTTLIAKSVTTEQLCGELFFGLVVTGAKSEPI